METATLVADGAVSWIPVRVEILACPAATFTPRHTSHDSACCYRTVEERRRNETGRVYLPRTRGTGVLSGIRSVSTHTHTHTEERL